MRHFIFFLLLLVSCEKLEIGKCYIHKSEAGLFLDHVTMYKIREFSYPDLDYRVAVWQKKGGWRTIGALPLDEHFIKVRCPKSAKEKVIWIVVPEEDLCYNGFPEKCY